MTDHPAEAAEIRRLREGLAELEWRKERTVAGTLNDFCPVCHGSPSHVRLNPHLAPRNGHRATCKLADLLGYPLAEPWSVEAQRAALHSLVPKDSDHA